MTTIEMQGITHELAFWKGFVKTDRFLDGWVAKVKTPELNQEVYQFIIDQSINRESLMEILDVGSGVVSILNGLPGHVTAADPLGGLYELIFEYKRHGLKAPLPIPAEEFGFDNCFDIVHCSNALDHCQKPLLALGKMLRACRPGGFVILQGFVNEAEHENYAGFHQWNISLTEEGGLKMSNKDSATTIHTGNDFVQDENFPEEGYQGKHILAKTIHLPQNKDWFIWIIQK